MRMTSMLRLAGGLFLAALAGIHPGTAAAQAVGVGAYAGTDTAVQPGNPVFKTGVEALIAGFERAGYDGSDLSPHLQGRRDEAAVLAKLKEIAAQKPAMETVVTAGFEVASARTGAGRDAEATVRARLYRLRDGALLDMVAAGEVRHPPAGQACDERCVQRLFGEAVAGAADKVARQLVQRLAEKPRAAQAAVPTFTIELLGFGDFRTRKAQQAMPQFPDFIGMEPIEISEDRSVFRYQTHASSSRLSRYLSRMAEELRTPASLDFRNEGLFVLDARGGGGTRPPGPGGLQGW